MTDNDPTNLVIEELRGENEAAGLGIPPEICGLRLCKVRRGRLAMCESIKFLRGAAAVDTVLRRAQIAGPVGPVGETGEQWADLLTENGEWTDTIALSLAAWNSLKNHWMRRKIESRDAG